MNSLISSKHESQEQEHWQPKLLTTNLLSITTCRIIVAECESNNPQLIEFPQFFDYLNIIEIMTLIQIHIQ